MRLLVRPDTVLCRHRDLACDFLEIWTLSGARMFVFAVIEYGSRRVRILGATAYPCASRVVQAAKNPVMDLADAGRGS